MILSEIYSLDFFGTSKRLAESASWNVHQVQNDDVTGYQLGCFPIQVRKGEDPRIWDVRYTGASNCNYTTFGYQASNQSRKAPLLSTCGQRTEKSLLRSWEIAKKLRNCWETGKSLIQECHKMGWFVSALTCSDVISASRVSPGLVFQGGTFVQSSHGILIRFSILNRESM